MKKLLPIIILFTSNLFAMDKMHNHNTADHNSNHIESVSDSMDDMLLKFTANLSNVQIVVVDVNGMVCDFCARGIEKTFYTDNDVKKVKVSLAKGKVLIAYSITKNIDLDEIRNIFLKNGQTATGIIVKNV